MNEWDRLSEMTVGTRRYLKKAETQRLLENAAAKMAKIELMRRRAERTMSRRMPSQSSIGQDEPLTAIPPAYPGVVELPAEGYDTQQPQQHYRPTSQPPYPDQRPYSGRQPSLGDKFMVVPEEAPAPRVSAELPYRASHEKIDYQSPSGNTATEPPPRPPKTPINEAPSPQAQYRLPMVRPNGNPRLPYPDTDGPPPIVSKLRKPEYTQR